jgi:dihydrofolate reductase
MAKTVFYTASTLDGFIATDDHSLDWLVTRDAGQDGPLDYAAFIAGIGSLCMGAHTYDWVYRACHDASGAETQPWGHTQACWVFTHHEVPFWPGSDVRLTASPVAEVHADLVAAEGGRDVWVVGGGDLAGQFPDLGLLDEVIVNIAPVTLGSGRPLTPRRIELRCLETATSGELLAARYEEVR